MLDDIVAPKTGSSNAIAALALLAGTREVEVDLPILQTKATVTPVTGAEDLVQKTMRTSGSKFIKAFNELLYNHTSFDSLQFSSADDFINHLTPPDKALLVYALLDSTFTKLPEKVITCPSCGTKNTYELPPSELVHEDTIGKGWDESADFDKYEIESVIIDGFKVVYKMPTEADRMQILLEKETSEMRDSVENNNDILNTLEMFCVYIKRLEIQTGNELLVLENKIKDIIPTIKGMPLELQSKLLEDTTVKPLVDYSPNFYLNIQCDNIHCESPVFKWENVNPEQDFFRKALSVYN